MDVADAIQMRRSYRGPFLPQSVPDAWIANVTRSALAAPSSKGAQPWRLDVVTHRATIERIARAMAGVDSSHYVPVDPATGQPRDYSSSVIASARTLAGAPLAIFFSTDGSFSGGRNALGTRGADIPALVGFGFEMVGIGAAVQNAWLCAVNHGLAGVFMGDILIVEDEIKETLGRREDLVGALVLGYPALRPRRYSQPGPGRARLRA